LFVSTSNLIPVRPHKCCFWV